VTSLDRDPDASTTLGLTTEQARALLAAAADHSHRMHALVALLLVDGLRNSEALSLDVDDVRGTDRGHSVVDLRRKGGRTARGAIPPLVADVIDTYLSHRARQRAEQDRAGRLDGARRRAITYRTAPRFCQTRPDRRRPAVPCERAEVA
jgi:integrase